MIKCIILLVLIAFVASDREEHWKNFKGKHGKKYRDAAHEADRKAKFMKNLDRIEKHNAKFAAGEVSYDVAVHHFSDKTIEEAQAELCGLKAPPITRALPQVYTKASAYPAATNISVDYRSDLLPVADQKSCGSCWAFSSLAQLEYLYKKKDPSFNTPLSKQYLVDCGTTTSGCNGGWPTNALTYIQDNGIVKESDYPYTGVQGACVNKPKLTNIIKYVSGFNYWDYDNGLTESNLKNILATEGPIVIGVSASRYFMDYKSGIFDNILCGKKNDINHAVLLVGYGYAIVNQIPKTYWLVRNSWSTSWGEQGYIRILRGSGICALGTTAWFATPI